MEDGRCKLGLQGRLELALLVEQGSTLRAAAAALSSRRHRPPLVASVGAGERCRASVSVVSGDTFVAAAFVPVGAEQHRRAGDPRCS